MSDEPQRSSSGGFGFGSGMCFLLLMVTCNNCNDITTLKGDMTTVRYGKASDHDVNQLEDRVETLENEVSRLKNEISRLKTERP